MVKRVPSVPYLVFLICGICHCVSPLIEKGWRPSPILTVPRPPWPCNSCLHSRLILICHGEFKFDLVNLDLPQWIWICRSEFEFAERIWICSGEFATADFNSPWRIWTCSGQLEFAAVNLNFAVVNLNLPWWILIFHGEFEFALVNLKLP